MCRLFGAVSQGPVYYDLFEEFADLAVEGNTPLGAPDDKGHKDGWGLAFFRNGELVLHVRGEGSAEGDPRYYGTAWRIGKTNIDRKAGQYLIVVGHLRRASPKMPVGREWSHPFVEEKAGRTWAFAHNGGLEGFAFDENEGLTDSQVLFKELLAHLDGTGPEAIAAATRATVASLRAGHGGYSSLNFLLTDGEYLHAFRECQESDTYHTLYRDDFGEALLICSQRILGMRDVEVPRGWLLTFGPNLQALETQILGP